MQTALAKRIFPRFSQFGVGSLPFKNPERAASFVMESPHLLPFWPELPVRGASEMMVARSKRTLTNAWTGYHEEEAAGAFALKRLLAGAGQKLPILKCQLPGPLTMLAMGDEIDEHFDRKLEIVSSACQRQIEWQINFFSDFAEHFLVVLDEPALIQSKSLGESRMQRLREAYSLLYIGTSDLGASLGLHSCAAFEPDFLSFPLELFSFDVRTLGFSQVFSDSTVHAWTSALDRGVVLAPGVLDSLGGEDHIRELKSGRLLLHTISNWLAKSSDHSNPLLLESATCGHAGATEAWVEYLYQSSDSLGGR